MPAWLRKMLGKAVKVDDRYVLLDARVEHYHDDAVDAWRWVRYERFADRQDAKGECMQGRHSAPVAQASLFVDASGLSLAFGGDFRQLTIRGERLEHFSFVNRAKGTRGGRSRWRLSDGSLLTEEVTFSAPDS